MLVQTFEHFNNPLASLLKIKDILKKGGLLFIEVPNLYSPIGFYRFKSYGAYHPSPNHCFIYSRKTIGAFLQRAGFKIHNMQGFINNRIISIKDDNCIEKSPEKPGNFYRVFVLFYLFSFINKITIELYRFFMKIRVKFI